MTHSTLGRRGFLTSGLGVVLGSIAGCIESRSPFAPPLVDNPPTGVYVPTHFEEMAMVGTATSGPYSAALSYSYPHRFWLVSGNERTKVPIKTEDSVHLMLRIWDTQTEQVVPGLNPLVSVSHANGSVTERVFWPMLSQRMSFHYGDNVRFPRDGTYQITIEVGRPAISRTDGFDDRLETGGRFTFDLSWSRSMLDDLAVTRVSKSERGTRGALSPMDVAGMAISPVTESLPGRRASARLGDLEFEASLVERSAGATLVVSPRTPYNRYPVPMLGLAARIPALSRRVVVSPALDPELGIHYRAALPTEIPVEQVSLGIQSPSQVTRHEGYETAFFETGSVDLRFS